MWIRGRVQVPMRAANVKIALCSRGFTMGTILETTTGSDANWVGARQRPSNVPRSSGGGDDPTDWEVEKSGISPMHPVASPTAGLLQLTRRRIRLVLTSPNGCRTRVKNCELVSAKDKGERQGKATC